MTDWTFDDGVEILDTTDTCAGGFATNINGIQQGKGSFKYNINGSGGFNGAVGGAAGTVSLQEGSGGASITGPVRVETAKANNPARGVVTGECNFVTNGSYTVT